MKSIQIPDTAHSNLVELKKLLKEQTNESIGQIVARLVSDEMKKIGGRESCLPKPLKIETDW